MKFQHVILSVFLLLSLSGLSSAADCGGAVPCACGDTVTESYMMMDSLLCGAGPGLIIGDNGVSLDCAGNAIQSVGGGTTAINSTGFSGVSVQNCFISDYDVAIYISGSTSSQVTENTISTLVEGIVVQDTLISLFSDNYVNGGTNGIRVDSLSSGNDFNDNTVQGSSYGIRVESAGNTLSGNTIIATNIYGLYVLSADSTVANNTHLYNNNGADVYVGTSSTPTQVTLDNLILDENAGFYQNYTNLSVTDTVDSSTSYVIDYTASLPLPPDTNNFHGKFVNITTTGSSSIDTLTWHWLSSEEGGFTASNLRVYKYNGSWVDLGATVNTTARTLTVTSHIPQSTYSVLESSSVEGVPMDLYGVNVNVTTQHGRFDNGTAQSNPTEGGNITGVAVSSAQLTEKWAAFYGDVVGGIVLRGATGSNYVYHWAWNATNGGAVCVSTNSSLTTFVAYVANGSSIDGAWSFSTADADSATNTFNQTNCSLDIGSATLNNTGYADTGAAGGFMTCTAKTTNSTPAKPDMIFCSEIINGGTTWDGGTADFELMVPTNNTPGATESYYFYANLD